MSNVTTKELRLDPLDLNSASYRREFRQEYGMKMESIDCTSFNNKLDLFGYNPGNAKFNNGNLIEFSLHRYKRTEEKKSSVHTDLEKTEFSTVIIQNTPIDQDCMGLIYQYYTDTNRFKYFDRFATRMNQYLMITRPNMISATVKKNIWERLSGLFKRDCPPIFLEYI